MKKLLLIGIGFVLAVAVFAGAGLVYAQTQNPPSPPFAGPGSPMGMPFAQDGDHPLQEYIIPAMAEVFGLTEEQTAALELSRETMASLRAERTPEEMQSAMQQVFSIAVENALADGAITQEQADQMLARAQQQGARVPGNARANLRSRAVDAYKQAFKAGKWVGRREMILQPYMEAAVADYMGVSVEELQQMHADGLTWQSYAQEQGLSDEELRDLRIELATTAVNNAVADGAITQEQADRILEHLQNPGWQPGAPGGMHPQP